MKVDDHSDVWKGLSELTNHHIAQTNFINLIYLDLAKCDKRTREYLDWLLLPCMVKYAFLLIVGRLRPTANSAAIQYDRTIYCF